MQFEEASSFLDTETGHVEVVTHYLLGLAEDGDGDDGEEPHLPAWQKHEWEIAKAIANSPERFEPLPDKFDIHEWSIMEEFARSVGTDRIRDELERAIHGKGAFRYFKDTLHRHRIQQDWYDFRAAALRQIAIDWCEGNQIEWRTEEN